MAASLSQRLEGPKSAPGRFMCGFGTVDEVFTVASFKGHKLSYSYMAGLIFTSYVGWVSGTAIGYVGGTFLPEVVQKAAVITVYAMFASLLGSKAKAVLVAALSALLNSILILVAGFQTGLAFIISMIAATIFGALIYSDEEVGIE